MAILRRTGRNQATAKATYPADAGSKYLGDRVQTTFEAFMMRTAPTPFDSICYFYETATANDGKTSVDYQVALLRVDASAGRIGCYYARLVSETAFFAASTSLFSHTGLLSEYAPDKSVWVIANTADTQSYVDMLHEGEVLYV